MGEDFFRKMERTVREQYVALPLPFRWLFWPLMKYRLRDLRRTEAQIEREIAGERAEEDRLKREGKWVQPPRKELIGEQIRRQYRERELKKQVDPFS